MRPVDYKIFGFPDPFKKMVIEKSIKRDGLHFSLRIERPLLAEQRKTFVTALMFSIAEKQVSLVAPDLDPKIYGRGPVTKLAKQFLRDHVHATLDVYVRDPIEPTSSVFFEELREYMKFGQVKIFYATGLTPENELTVVDGAHHWRVHGTEEIVGSFGDPATGKALVEKLAMLREHADQWVPFRTTGVYGKIEFDQPHA